MISTVPAEGEENSTTTAFLLLLTTNTISSEENKLSLSLSLLNIMDAVVAEESGRNPVSVSAGE